MTDLLPPLLLPLLATLPAMTSIQINQAISSAKQRLPAPAYPRSASMRRLIKALKLHPLTISATIEISGQGFPVLSIVREISKDEVDSITDWINGDRIQTLEQTYILQPEAHQ
jgi:hypothetical protein